MEDKKYLSVTEAQNLYGISRWTLYRWAAERKLPSYKIGKLRRFSKTDLDKFFEDHKTLV